MNYTVIGRSAALTEYPVSGFTAFTGSVTPINAFGTPEITNTTFLWLLINPGHDCLLLTYAGNQSTAEPCDSAAYLSSNATYAEVIEFGNPPFNVVTATLNGSTLYTGAWQWLDSPSNYSVLNGNNTAAINFTINVPPMRCMNVTNPRTGVTHGKVLSRGGGVCNALVLRERCVNQRANQGRKLNDMPILGAEQHTLQNGEHKR